MSDPEHQNSRYEYMTRSVAYSTDVAMTRTFDAEFNAQGWARVWADFDMEGCFIVYRRARSAKAQP